MDIKSNLKHCFLILLISFFYLHNANATEVRQPSSPLVKSYELDVSLYPEESRMEGLSVVSFVDRPDLSELVFYLHGELSIESIMHDNKHLPFQQEKVLYDYNYSMVATRVVVDIKTSVIKGKLSVKYGGFFHPSKARANSDYMRIDPSGVYLRSFGYSLWFPIFLEPGEESPEVSFSHVRLRTPKDYTAVFVGERLNDQVIGDSRVSEWRVSNISLFSVQCTAHRFSIHQSDNYFVYARQDNSSNKMIPKITDFATNLNRLLRKHYKANAKLQQVHILEMPRYGDISSGNLVGMSSDIWREFDSSKFPKQTLAHEFVHPFVQVNTPVNDPLRAFVTEGFPSYFHWPVLAELMGEDYYAEHMDWVHQGYLEKKASGMDRRGNPLPPEKPLLSITEEEIGLYKDRFILSDRAILFFDYLRRKMGKDKFIKFAKKLVNIETLNINIFHETILHYSSEMSVDLRLWLETSAYPVKFHRPSVKNELNRK